VSDEDGAEGFFGGGVVESTEENVTDSDRFFPLTVREPEDLDMLYPDMLPIVYEYVPLVMENVIVFAVDDNVVPFRFTDHDVPEGRPDSVKATVYNSMKLTDSDSGEPSTLKDPEDGEGS
jgi:hypothetical protein